ncbi:MAG: FlgD immunoglobulin-like domain containing protein [Candidatus Eisenbacteria bacterium]
MTGLGSGRRNCRWLRTSTADASAPDEPGHRLSGATEATLSYWRWYAQFGPTDASYTAQVSSNGGATWSTLETLNTNHNSWENVVVDLSTVVAFTNNVRFRFQACDTGSDTLLETAIDDFVISGVGQDPSDAPDVTIPARTQLLPNRPNPFREGTVLRYQLATSGSVRLAVYDASGRQVRSLVSGTQTAGSHSIEWDGRNDSGTVLPAGVYLDRLETEGTTSERKMLRMK